METTHGEKAYASFRAEIQQGDKIFISYAKGEIIAAALTGIVTGVQWGKLSASCTGTYINRDPVGNEGASDLIFFSGTCEVEVEGKFTCHLFGRTVFDRTHWTLIIPEHIGV